MTNVRPIHELPLGFWELVHFGKATQTVDPEFSPSTITRTAHSAIDNPSNRETLCPNRADNRGGGAEVKNNEIVGM